jgi:hypothetical protein
MRPHGALILAAALAFPAIAGQPARSAAELLAFKRQNPCPSTGQRRGACPGYVIDHINPLCNGGPDQRSNMQWQTVADGLRKDADERRLCRTLRH